MLLDKDSSTPLYLQLKNLLEKQVEEGLYQDGKAIPSERELCQAYGVSRITVRQAIAQAIAEGLLYRRQGKGTFVVKKKIDQSLERITGFEGTIAGQGLLPVTSLIDVSRASATEDVAAALGLEKGSPVVRMILLGLADSEPLALYTSHFAPELGWAMGEKAAELTRQGRPFTSFDLYKHLDGWKPARARQTFEAALATGRVARLLKVKEPTAVFVVTSVVVSSDGSPLEHRIVHYRGDRYKFSVIREVAV